MRMILSLRILKIGFRIQTTCMSRRNQFMKCRSHIWPSQQFRARSICKVTLKTGFKSYLQAVSRFLKILWNRCKLFASTIISKTGRSWIMLKEHTSKIAQEIKKQRLLSNEVISMKLVDGTNDCQTNLKRPNNSTRLSMERKKQVWCKKHFTNLKTKKLAC